MILQIQYKELPDQFFLIYNFIYSFIYLFLAMLGLPCCGDFSLVVVSGCYSLVVRGPLIAVASLVVGHGLQGVQASVLQAYGLQSMGSVVVAHGLSYSQACGILLDQGLNLCFLYLQAPSLPLSCQGGPGPPSSKPNLTGMPLPRCLGNVLEQQTSHNTDAASPASGKTIQVRPSWWDTSVPCVTTFSSEWHHSSLSLVPTECVSALLRSSFPIFHPYIPPALSDCLDCGTKRTN